MEIDLSEYPMIRFVVVMSLLSALFGELKFLVASVRTIRAIYSDEEFAVVAISIVISLVIFFGMWYYISTTIARMLKNEAEPTPNANTPSIPERKRRGGRGGSRTN